MRLLGLVDRRARQPGVVEQHADGRARGQDRRAGAPSPDRRRASRPPWCSTIGQSSNTVKWAPSSSARRKASRSVSLSEYMMWCSSTIAPCRSDPQVPSIMLRERSSRKIAARARPIRSRATSTARRRIASGSSSARISSNADSRAASCPPDGPVHHLGRGRIRPRRPEDQRPVYAPAAAHGRWKVDVRSCAFAAGHGSGKA